MLLLMEQTIELGILTPRRKFGLQRSSMGLDYDMSLLVHSTMEISCGPMDRLLLGIVPTFKSFDSV